ncbi:MalY/PatB family protein [Cohnella thailandensis]|uniref:cysteine-S-conjugate beta-lyase n=1 Tax=Cohnella thailandensis TaxID=557557 RepID=A0A841SXS4_9BACL|nr:MalY/PatB family protein [Cohnella thailandensis]MBB6634978.1 pyridoxal phosphate-dependent aminotransferase [Cohnella thailandensis]MBP1975799.1 cystathionine beta-lyase [Cohnella thailandensis]
MKYDFDEIVNRRGTYSVKWDGGEFLKKHGMTERYDEETIPLFTADMDLPVPQPVVDALHRTVDHRIYGYSVVPDEYYEAIQGWFKRRHDWDIRREEIVYCPGTVHAIFAAVRTFTEPGDGVIIQRPVYPPFTMAIEKNGRTVVNNALKQGEDGRYEIDFDDFEAKAKEPSTTMFILCNPHNPTGRIFRPEELKRLADICRANGVLIVADEIHGDLIRRNETFVPIAKVAEAGTPIVTCTAVNKTFNLAGLHCTNLVISDPELREKFTQALGHAPATPFAYSALIAAYNEGEEWLDQLKEYLDGTFEFALAFLRERMPKVKAVMPEGTYVLWMDFSGYGLSAEEVRDRVYHRANVLLQEGKQFGEEGAGFLRMCIPSPRPLIKEALERIAREFEDIR